MTNWLPWMFLAFVVVVLAAMPWRRPHPNHEFMLDMLRLLEEEDSEPARSSSATGLPSGSPPSWPVMGSSK